MGPISQLANINIAGLHCGELYVNLTNDGLSSESMACLELRKPLEKVLFACTAYDFIHFRNRLAVKGQICRLTHISDVQR